MMLALFLLFFPLGISSFVTAQTHQTLPSTSNANFPTNLSNFLLFEDANRYADMFGPFVKDGTGLHGTSVTLVSPSFSSTFYTSTGRYWVQPPASIDYGTVGCAATDTAWVIATDATTGNTGNFVRVGTTHYAVNCVDTTQPALPASSVYLFRATLVGGAISAVTPLGSRFPALVIPDSGTISAMQYGAKCDGVTDDGPAINRALATEHHIRIPATGSCCQSSETLLIPSGKTLSGPGCIQAMTNFGDVPLIANTNGSPATDGARDTDIRIQDLTIDGNKANNGTGSEHSPCIFLRSVVDAWVENIHCLNPKGDGIQIGSGTTVTVIPLRNQVHRAHVVSPGRNGIAMTECDTCGIEANEVSGSGLHGIDVEGDSSASILTSIIIIGNHVLNAGSTVFDFGITISSNGNVNSLIVVSGNTVIGGTGGGIGFRDSDTLVISENTIRAPSRVCIQHFSGGTSINNVLIAANILNACGLQGITYAGTNGASIKNNDINACGAASAGSGNGLQIDSMLNGTITGNRIVSCGNEGMLLTSVQKTTITGNTSNGNATRGLRLITSNDLTVVGNTFETNGDVGINEDAGSSFNLFANNMLRNNVSAGGQFLGTNNQVNNNVGWTTESVSTATVGSGVTSVAFNHGLSVTPNNYDILLTPITSATNDYGNFWVDSCGVTQCTAHVRNDPGASGVTFGVQVQVH